MGKENHPVSFIDVAKRDLENLKQLGLEIEDGEVLLPKDFLRLITSYLVEAVLSTNEIHPAGMVSLDGLANFSSDAIFEVAINSCNVDIGKMPKDLASSSEEVKRESMYLGGARTFFINMRHALKELEDK